LSQRRSGAEPQPPKCILAFLDARWLFLAYKKLLVMVQPHCIFYSAKHIFQHFGGGFESVAPPLKYMALTEKNHYRMQPTSNKCTFERRLKRVLLSAFCSFFFTALHGMQTRSYDEISVRPSVHPSVCLSVRLSVCQTRAL